MQPVQRQKSETTQEILDGIEIGIATERLRRARAEGRFQDRIEAAEAEAAERRTENQDRIECGDAESAERRATATKHENWRGWISLLIFALCATVAVVGGSADPVAIDDARSPALSLGTLTATTTSGQDAVGEPPMTETPPEPSRHLSSSTVQGDVELEMLKILGVEIGTPLAKTKVDYHGARMEIDGIDSDESVFVEAFAHLGTFKPGQRRKIANDVLKFVALQANYPQARFILAFADEAAMASVTGWLRTVVDQQKIEMVVVGIPSVSKEKLAKAQIDQKAGMETGG
jgi:hypothetical protein